MDQPIQSTHRDNTAKWNVVDGRLQNRAYLDLNDTLIDPKNKGWALPAKSIVEDISKNTELMQTVLASTLLYTNLPEAFYAKLLTILDTSEKSYFPRMGKNKSCLVEAGIEEINKDFSNLLAIDKWEELGWDTEKAYTTWLDTPVLFAFSGCGHYCQSPRVFDYLGCEDGIDNFKQVNPSEPKFTNIFSIAGFEFRGMNLRKVEEQVESNHISKYSSVIMQQILNAANATQTTDIVLIPFGMGVFLTCEKDKVKEQILAGWIDALEQYTGNTITLHCCLMDGQFEKIRDQLKDKASIITLVNRTGEDAYTVANAIQDDPSATKKSMLVNAGDHDWIVQLDCGKGPGQCSNNHTLYHSTADEYFALMTLFQAFSISNLLQVNKGDLTPFINKEATSPKDLTEKLKKYFMTNSGRRAAPWGAARAGARAGGSSPQTHNISGFDLAFMIVIGVGVLAMMGIIPYSILVISMMAFGLKKMYFKTFSPRESAQTESYDPLDPTPTENRTNEPPAGLNAGAPNQRQYFPHKWALKADAGAGLDVRAEAPKNPQAAPTTQSLR